jgi:hypothetical protein
MAIATRLEKVAVDNGFDLELPREKGWLHFASSQAPLQLWLSTFGEAIFVVGFSQLNVARALTDHGVAMSAPLPAGAVAGRTVTDIPELHRLVRRAFQLARTLPDELLHAFEKRTAELPRATEIERLVVQRVGQDIFRAGLIEYWEGRCAVTGLGIPELLRASHIKPWAHCVIDAERLDVFNGILLAPNLDGAFDRGFVTFADDGDIVIADRLDAEAREALALDTAMRVSNLTRDHRSYLTWHREYVFRSS